MNLPPDKVKILSQYDNEKKWDLICDQVGLLSTFSLRFPQNSSPNPKNKPINGPCFRPINIKAKHEKPPQSSETHKYTEAH